MSKADGGPRPSLGKWASLGRTVGSAVNEVRRLFVTQHRPRTTASRATLSRLIGMRRQLESEVSELEAKLEQLHTIITNNPLPHSNDAGRANLEALIQRARRLRQRVRDKRDTLARIERHIARERWLAEASRSQPARQRPRKRRPAPRAKKARRANKIDSILKRSPFHSRTERAALHSLAQALSSPGAERRHAACQRLAQFRVPAARNLLVTALDDPSERVQLAALNGLAGARGRRAAQAFRRFVNHKNPALRLTALRGLAGAGPGFVTRAELTRALSDADAAVRKFALRILSWRGDGDRDGPRSAALPELALALHDDDMAVRLGAVEALAATGSDRSVAALIRALADEAEEVREAAFAAIRTIVGPEADEVGPGLAPQERAAAFKQWWATARVDVALRTRSARPERAAPPPERPATRSSPAPAAVPAPAASPPAERDETSESPAEAPTGTAGLSKELASQIAIAEVGADSDLASQIAIAEVGADSDLASQVAAAEAAPDDLNELSEQAGFESVFGEESTTAVAATGLEPAAEESEQFESLFGEDGSENKDAPSADADADADKSAEGEEYENVFGSEED